MSETKTDLIPIEKINAVEVFTGEALDDLLAKIEAEARRHTFDIGTPGGRKDCASLAYKVARSKTAIDDAGKGLVEEWKKQSKVVDYARKKARDRLDALRDEVRKPLTDWEAEEKRVADEAAAAERARVEKIDSVFRQIGELRGEAGAHNDCEEIKRALDDLEVMIDATFGEREQPARDALAGARDAIARAEDIAKREREVKAKEAEIARKEAEQRAQEEAARRAKEQAEREERIRREAAEKAEREAREAVERAEREKAEAEQHARQAEADARAKLEAEAEAKRAEEERRGRHAKRRSAVHNAASDAIVDFIDAIVDFNERKDTAKDIALEIIEAIAAGKVPHVSISYA